MTPEQRQTTVDLLRQLATWLEDGEELEQYVGGEWQPIGPTFFDGVLYWQGSLRAKPMERWFVKLKLGGIYYDTASDAERHELDSDYVRTVHLREVEE